MAFDEERAIELRNLVTGESVAMPRPPAFPVAKIVLSAPPTSLGWVAAVLGSSGTLALVQPDSGGAWITIVAAAKHGGLRDVAFWRGRVCALGDDGTILAYRADLRARVAAVSELNYGLIWRWDRRTYLVESEGELLLVRRRFGVLAVEAQRFRPEERKWEEVTELPGRALFVGAVASVSVLVAAALPGVRENCVYFARRDVDMVVTHPISVCSMVDRETAMLAIAGGHSVEVEPVWIIPSVA
jgi:hypothetical protein